MVVADSEQFLCFSIFDFCVCVGVLTGCSGSGRKAITAGPRFMGHRAGGDASEPVCCTWAGTRAGKLSGSEASAFVWACGFPSSSILFPAALCQHGGQEEDGEWGSWGTIKHDQGGFVCHRGWCWVEGAGFQSGGDGWLQEREACPYE